MQNDVGFLTFLSRCFFENLHLRYTVDYKRTPELQNTFVRLKRKFTDGTLRLEIPNSDKPFYILCDAPNYGSGTALL